MSFFRLFSTTPLMYSSCLSLDLLHRRLGSLTHSRRLKPRESATVLRLASFTLAFHLVAFNCFLRPAHVAATRTRPLSTLRRYPHTGRSPRPPSSLPLIEVINSTRTSLRAHARRWNQTDRLAQLPHIPCRILKLPHKPSSRILDSSSSRDCRREVSLGWTRSFGRRRASRCVLPSSSCPRPHPPRPAHISALSQGVKFIPAGLHLFVFSAAPSASQQAHLPESLSSGVGVRSGILRFFRQGETVVEEWDNAREELKGPQRSVKRRRTIQAGEAREETVVSEEYLKELDASLAPYPQEEIAKQWASLTEHVTERTLARVVGLEEKASGQVDALMGSSMDVTAAGPDGSGKRTWGKARAEEGNEEVEEEGEKIKEIFDEEEEENLAVTEALLEFVTFDEKRSWPKGAVGEELSRWSKDKSWLLSEVVQSQLHDGVFSHLLFTRLAADYNSLADPQEFLAELQLSFVLFSLLHNFSSLTVYKSLFSLLCRSISLVYPPSSRPSSTPLPSPTLSTAALPLFASFLSLFAAQVEFLDSTFFSTQLPSLEAHLLDSLSALSTSLSDALPAWLVIAQDDPHVERVWKEVIKRWDALAAITSEKFGWDLGIIRGSRAKYTTAAAGQGRVYKEEDELDFEELEEGEDAPVIVDDEGLYLDSDDY